MSDDTVLAFCPRPSDSPRVRDLPLPTRALHEEWFALPEDLDDGFMGDQCDNCGSSNGYSAVPCTTHLYGEACGKVYAKCDDCGWEYVTAWLPEGVVVF